MVRNIPDNYVLTVGNSMMGDDGAGPLLAELMQDKPVPGWGVIDGGSTPENVSSELRALAPKRLLIVDATDMAIEPGEIRFVEHEQIAQMMIISTHAMSLTFLIEQLQEDIADIIFLGIQPETVAFYYPMSQVVTQAVHRIHQGLAQGLPDIAWL